ncbi:MAG TPA: OmpH family outer membrane protein [Magnetospirillaceae bacterium]|nr:OmpH family outer membrane protein [Magnetospirillaceae bacterium]
MNTRRIAAAAFLILAALIPVWAQQITRVAVVDLSRVYRTYARDSAAVRRLEEDRQRIQTEIDRMSGEIRQLQARRADALARSDQIEILRMDQELIRRAQHITEFYKARQAELDDRSRQLMEGSDFYQLVYRTVQSIAEAEGFSVILNINPAGSVVSPIIWYSPAMDITDKVIQNLIGLAR